MKKKTKYLLTGGVLGILIVVGLYLTAQNEMNKTFFKNGGFVRTYVNNPPFKLQTFTQLKNANNITFIGSAPHGIYWYDRAWKNMFYTYLVGNSLMSKNINTPNHIPHDKRAIKHQDSIMAYYPTSKFDYFIYNETLFAFNKRSKLLKTFQLNADDWIPIGSLQFAKTTYNPVVFDNNHLIIKQFHNNEFLSTIQLYADGQLIASNNSLFGNGISLSDDGHIVQSDNGYIYVCSFKNTVLLLDEKLNVIKSSSTIDTVQTPPSLTEKNWSSTAKKVTYKHQPTFANRFVQFHKGMLWVQSGILADNDKEKSLTRNLILDTYQLNENDGLMYKYSYNIIIPSPIGETPISFHFLNDKLYVNFKKAYIAVYNIQNP